MFRTDARVKLREIVFSQIAGEPIPVLMQQANQIQEMLQNGSPFEVLAAQHGQSPFREKGGDWGVMVTSREIRSDEIRKMHLALKRRNLQAVCCRALGAKSRWSGWQVRENRNLHSESRKS